MRNWSRILPVALVAGLVACGERAPEKASLVVYAAASLRDVAVDLAAELERQHAARVVYNFAGSNTLAQQIRAAPGADVFLSADEDWIDFLEREERTVGGTRRAFLTNRLVLIVRRDAAVDLGEIGELAAAFSPEVGGLSHLALADPRAVPAGRYAREVLRRLASNDTDLWSALAGQVAPTLDVRAALALVESDPAIAGIVYRTDALRSDQVRVLLELPVVEEVPIHYGGVLIAGSEQPELGRLFLEFLCDPAAGAIVERHGFGPLECAG